MALLKEAYFVSPEYESELKTRKDEDIIVLDKRDDLPEWLEKNTFPHRARDLAAVTYYGGKLVGENGVHCEIITDESVKGVSGKIKPSPAGDYGAYKRIVRVLAMPSSKPLPREFREALDSRRYVEADERNPCIKHWAEKFR